MNTIKYSANYTDGVEDLLRREDNIVSLPSNIYFDIAKLMSAEHSDKQKLHKSLAKTYSFLAFENDELVGFASMDKEGCLGILVTASGEYSNKAAKSLLKALERSAAKKELANIFVVQTTDSEEFFLKNGYAPVENPDGEGLNESMLAKEIAVKEKFDITPDKVRKIRLDPSKPIKVEDKIVVLPTLLFVVACIFAGVIAVISIVEYVSNGSLDFKFNTFFIVAGVLFVLATALFTAYMLRGRRIKREILEEMEVTNGIVTSVSIERYYVRNGDGDSERRSRVSVFYSFYDGDTKRSGSASRTYQNDKIKFFAGQEVIIAYSEDNSYLLKKYTIMDELPVKSQSEGAEPAKNAEIKHTENVETVSDISEYMPIKERKIFYVCSFVFLCTEVVAVAAILVVLAVLSANSTVSFKTLLDDMSLMLIFVSVLCCGLSAFYLALPLSARLKYKSLLKVGYKAVNGKLVCSETTYKGNGSPRYSCVYKDTEGVAHEIKLRRWYANRMVAAGKTDAVVVYDNKTAIVLVKKYKLPIRLR